MELRRLLLRVLLGALALAALAGVVGVVTAAGETIWRIVGTAILTAVAVALMLPFSGMMDKQKWRAGGLGGLAWTVVAYLLGATLIWSDPIFGSWRWPEAVGLTLLSWIACGLPAVFLMSLAAMPEARVAARTGIPLAAATFALLFAGAWSYALRVFESDKWPAGAAALGALGALVVVNLVHAGTDDRRWWRWAGVVAAAGAWLVAEAGILQGTDSLLGRQVLTALASTAAVVGLANLAMLVPLVGAQEWVRWGTILAAAICAGATNLLVYFERLWQAELAGRVVAGAAFVAFERTWEEELWGRVAAGSGIVAGCGSLALLVLARINRRVEYRPEEGAVLVSNIAVVCPRCSRSQRVRLGGAACAGCGLRIEITIEEPRCPKCGYLIYKLASPICPECGTAIAAGAQAGAVRTDA